MSLWRQIRDRLAGRYIEIAQEDMASDPIEVAVRLTDFVRMPVYSMAVAHLLTTRRFLSSYPDKRPGDYNYCIDWSPEQKEVFVETCGMEMQAWGYEINFESPGRDLEEELLLEQPANLVAMIEQRDARIAELESQCRALLKHVAQVEQGRIMQFLNWCRERKSKWLDR